MDSNIYFQFDKAGNSGTVQYCTPEQQLLRDQEDQRKLIEELEREGMPELDEFSDEDDEFEGQYSLSKKSGLIQNGCNGNHKFIETPMVNQYAQTYKESGHDPLINGYHRTSTGGEVNGVNNHSPDDKSLMLAVREREIAALRRQLDTKLHDCRTLESQLAAATMERDRASLSVQCLEKDLAEFKDKFDQLMIKDDALQKDISLKTMELQDRDKMLKILQNGSQEEARLAALERQIQAKEEKHRVDIVNLNGEYEGLFKKYKQLQTDNLELEMKIKNLKNNIEELETEKSVQLTRLLTEKNILEDRLRMQSDEPRSGALSELENVEKSLRAELAQKDSLLNTLRIEILAKQAAPSADPAQFDILKSRIVELERKLCEKEEEVVEMTIQKARSLTQDDLDHHKKSQELWKLEEEKEELRVQIKKLSVDLAEKNHLVEELRCENDSIKKTYLDEQELYNSEKKTLQEKIDALNKSLLELQTNHTRFCQTELENKAREIELLKAESETKTHQLQALKSLVEITEKANTLDNEDVHEQMKLLEEQRAADAAEFEQQTNRLLKAHREEITKITDAHNVLKAELDRLKGELPSVSRLRDAETSPIERCMSESEVMSILQTVAAKHEAEVMQFESEISELNAKMEAAQKSTRAPPPPITDGETSQPSSPELLMQLWRRYEEVVRSHDQLSARSKESETELSRALEETDRMKDRLKKVQTEYQTCFDKYNKLKVQAKHYRDYYEGANKKLKEDFDVERKKWEKDRTKWLKSEEGWRAERLKHERSLAEVLSELQKIKHCQPPPLTLDGILKLYNEEMRRLES